MSKKRQRKRSRQNGTSTASAGDRPVDTRTGGMRERKASASAARAGSTLQRLIGDRLGRRRALQWIGGLGLASIGAVAIARHDARTRELHDLSVIGDGTPVVVQVHDPSCPLCRRLMATTRDTLDDMPSIRYRVADLTSEDGRAFGDAHRAGKVTLLLFDRGGDLVGRVEGVTPADSLRRTFEERLAGPT